MTVNIEQIRDLDDRLHEAEREMYAPVPNMGPQPDPWNRPKVKVRHLDRSYVMTDDELGMIKDYLRASDDSFIIPSNECYGFAVGFRIIKVSEPLFPGVPTEYETLCTFVEKQMPVERGWDEMHAHVFTERNLRMAQEAGHEIHDNRAHYDY